ncbi:MAG: hypothetical protein WC712_06300 [Candidatus Brocadiia bacterium]
MRNRVCVLSCLFLTLCASLCGCSPGSRSDGIVIRSGRHSLAEVCATGVARHVLFTEGATCLLGVSSLRKGITYRIEGAAVEVMGDLQVPNGVSVEIIKPREFSGSLQADVSGSLILEGIPGKLDAAVSVQKGGRFRCTDLTLCDSSGQFVKADAAEEVALTSVRVGRISRQMLGGSSNSWTLTSCDFLCENVTSPVVVLCGREVHVEKSRFIVGGDFGISGWRIDGVFRFKATGTATFENCEFACDETLKEKCGRFVEVLARYLLCRGNKFSGIRAEVPVALYGLLMDVTSNVFESIEARGTFLVSAVLVSSAYGCLFYGNKFVGCESDGAVTSFFGHYSCVRQNTYDKCLGGDKSWLLAVWGDASIIGNSITGCSLHGLFSVNFSSRAFADKIISTALKSGSISGNEVFTLVSSVPGVSPEVESAAKQSNRIAERPSWWSTSSDWALVTCDLGEAAFWADRGLAEFLPDAGDFWGEYALW